MCVCVCVCVCVWVCVCVLVRVCMCVYVSTCSGTLVHQVILPSADIDRSASTRACLRHYHIIKDKHSAACVIIPLRPWCICGMQSILCFIYRLACTGKRVFWISFTFPVPTKKGQGSEGVWRWNTMHSRNHGSKIAKLRVFQALSGIRSTTIEFVIQF